MKQYRNRKKIDDPNKLQFYFFERGFTLIELLVVIGIFIIFSVIVLSILFSILRGTKKSDSVNIVRENGDQAMTQIIKSLRFAQSLDYPSPVGGSAPVCSVNGTNVPEVRITTVNALTTIVRCPANFNAPNFILLNGSSLTNSNNVVVKSCYFVCTQKSGESPTIGINFSLTKINLSGLPEDAILKPYNFQSSVVLRNIGG